MLILSRKIQEQIIIPELNIRLTVLSIGTNRVQLGIEAPDNIQVTRPDAQHTPHRHSVAPVKELRTPKASLSGRAASRFSVDLVTAR